MNDRNISFSLLDFSSFLSIIAVNISSLEVINNFKQAVTIKLTQGNADFQNISWQKNKGIGYLIESTSSSINLENSVLFSSKTEISQYSEYFVVLEFSNFWLKSTTIYCEYNRGGIIASSSFIEIQNSIFTSCFCNRGAAISTN